MKHNTVLKSHVGLHPETIGLLHLFFLLVVLPIQRHSASQNLPGVLPYRVRILYLVVRNRQNHLVVRSRQIRHGSKFV
jgi:hypothetical protein